MYGKNKYRSTSNRTRYPYKGKRRNTSSVKKYGSRYRTTTASKKWPLWKNPLSQKAAYKFKFADSGFSMSTSAPTYVNSYVFRGNSLYDPDITGVGVQPYGFDNYCNANAPFQRYCVKASKIKIYPHVYDGESDIRAVRWVVVPTRTNPPTYSEFEDLKQIPMNRSLVINSPDDQQGKLIAYTSTRKMYPEMEALTNDFANLYNNNPNSVWYWYIQVDTLDSGKETIMCFDVEITYYAVLSRSDDVNES